MVDGIVAAVGSRQDDLGDRNKCVALLEQLFKNAGQGFRGVEGGVVKEHDGSRLDLGSDPLRDLRRRKVLPVQAVHIPLYGLHADGADRSDHVIVILSIRRPDQGGTHAGHRLDLVVAGLHIGNDLLFGELRHMGVIVGVVHHLVPGIMERLDRFGVFIHPRAYHKKRCLDVILAQDVDKLLGILIAPGCVKGDGEHLLIPLDAVDGQLPVGGIGADRRRIIDHIEHGRRRQGAGQGGQALSLEQKHFHSWTS